LLSLPEQARRATGRHAGGALNNVEDGVSAATLVELYRLSTLACHLDF